MQALITDAVFLSNSENSFNDRETGEVRTFYRATFVQDGSDPMTISIDERLYNAFDYLGRYNLDLDISSFNNKFRCKVIGFARLDAGDE